MKSLFVLFLLMLSPASAIQAQTSFPEDIKPLLKTHWSQDDPFNRLCPLIDIASKKVRMKAGCGPVTMAQLICYHQFPSMSPDGKFVYHWNLMFKSTDEPLSQNQVTSVAKLINDCGVSAFTTYGEEASSTFIVGMLQALKRHYHYSKYAWMASREQLAKIYGSDAEWCRLIYENLKGNRPVVMRGSYADDSKQGHVFIVDGCKGNKIHTNMGWGGHMDGYYHLDVTGFSAKQAALMDMADSTYRPEIKTFKVEKPGMLASLVDTLAKAPFHHVKIIGGIDHNDWLVLKALGMTTMASLDLTETTITEVPDSAMAGCGQLTYVRLPATVKFIGRDAFRRCVSLNNVDMPSSLKRIGSGAFSGCRGLIEIDLPEGLESIGANAFNGCRSLIEVEVPASVKRVGNYAFAHCRNLWRLDFKGNVEKMGVDVTEDCAKLRKV